MTNSKTKLTKFGKRYIRMAAYVKGRLSMKYKPSKKLILNLSAIGKAPLSVPSANQQIINFQQLVKVNFKRKGDFGSIYDDPYQGWDGDWPIIAKGNVYDRLKQYSRTNQGAMMIARILKNNIIAKRKGTRIFKILYTVNKGEPQAQGDTNFIWFGGKFGYRKTFMGGEKIDLPSVIQHELGHSRFYNKKRKEVSIQDERAVVIYIENPMRKKRGYEYRYTYKQGNKTINIITGETSVVNHTVLDTDPTVLVKIGSPGALI